MEIAGNCCRFGRFLGQMARFCDKYLGYAWPLVVRYDDPRYKACRTACSVTAWLLSRPWYERRG